MSGSRPDADAVTASTGTLASAGSPLSSRYALTLLATILRSFGFVGPRFEPLLRVGSYPASVFPSAPTAADGRDWKYLRIGSPFESTNDWPIRLDPTCLPSRSTSDPSALSLKPTCAIPVTRSE